MHYYSHHIGDFIKDTARLTDSQCMAYLRMIWIYYDTESPLADDADAIAFEIGASASDVHQILKRFFFLHDDGKWHHSRCDKEILDFLKKSEKARKSANARWENANAMRTHGQKQAAFTNKENANACERMQTHAKGPHEDQKSHNKNAQIMRTHSERNANERKTDATHNPIPNTHEGEIKHGENSPDGDSPAQPDPPEKPVTEKHRAKGVTKAQMRESFPELADQTIDDWITARKDKGAKTLTLTAWNTVVNEIRISGLTGEQALQIAAARGWQGVKAEWLLNHISGSHGPPARAPATPAVSRNAIEIQAWLESHGDERH